MKNTWAAKVVGGFIGWDKDVVKHDARLGKLITDLQSEADADTALGSNEQNQFSSTSSV